MLALIKATETREEEEYLSLNTHIIFLKTQNHQIRAHPHVHILLAHILYTDTWGGYGYATNTLAFIKSD